MSPRSVLVVNDDFIKKNRLGDALNAVTRCIETLESCEEWVDTRVEVQALESLRSDIREELRTR